MDTDAGSNPVLEQLFFVLQTFHYPFFYFADPSSSGFVSRNVGLHFKCCMQTARVYNRKADSVAYNLSATRPSVYQIQLVL